MGISVSVIMPSLNVGQYIEECIQSVIRQTLRDIEIICIDAGSTDGTVEIIKRYADLDERIIFVSSDVKSYGYQVNMGIQMAKGEYIAILETDDFVADNMYERLYANAKSYDLDVCKGDYYTVYHDSMDLLGERHISDLVDIQYNKVFMQSDAYKLILLDANIWKGIYRRDFLIKNDIVINTTPGAAYQDIDFLMQAAYANPRIMYISDPLYYYRCGRAGSSSCSTDVLRYVYQECLYLSNQGILSNDKEITKYIYARLLICFIYEYDRLSEMFNYTLMQDGVRLYYNHFKNLFYDAINIFPDIKGLINYDKLIDVFENEEEYLSKKQQLLREKNSVIEKLLGVGTILIFGCGKYGKSALRTLLDYDISQIVFCDNNESLWGTCMCGFPVYEPAYILNRHKGPIIIANKNNYQDIMHQINKYALDNEIVNAEILLN